MLRRFAPLGLVLLAACGLSACGQADLYTNVSEREANEMMVALAQAGVEAKKRPGAQDAFIVSAPGGDFTYAMQVLSAADFPRYEDDGVFDAMLEQTMVSTQAQERLRTNAYLTAQLNESLTTIDGVQVARVHVVTPVKNRMGQAFAEPTASVLIKHHPDADIASEVAQVKNIVTNAVEDLSYDRVTVALFPAARVPVRAEPPVEQAAAELAMPALGGLGALALAFAAFKSGRRKATKPPAEIEGPQGSPGQHGG